jgi:hypothetical protein
LRNAATSYPLALLIVELQSFTQSTGILFISCLILTL